VLALWLLWWPASSAAEQDVAAKTADLLPAVATRIVGNGPTDVRHPTRDVRPERPSGGERDPTMRAWSRDPRRPSQSLRETDVAATLTST